MTDIFLSIIVCTYNRAALLEKCLASLAPQIKDRKDVELLVVNNNSTDHTARVIERYLDSGQVHSIFEAVQGHSQARNRGYSESKGSYLIYMDDDALTPDRYVDNVISVINEYAPDILGGPLYPYYLHPKPFWFKDRYEIRKWAEQSSFSQTCRISGANFIIKKDVLANLGLFDVNLGMRGSQTGLGDEAKVLDTYRRGTAHDKQKVYYSLECYILHYVSPGKMTVAYCLGRSYAYGRDSLRAVDKPGNDLGVLGVLRMLTNALYSAINSNLRQLIKDLRTYGVKDTDYLIIPKALFTCFGLITEGIRLLRLRPNP